MANTVISVRSSGLPGNTPSLGVIANGELALNYADGILYYKSASNTLGQIKTTQPAGLNKELQFNDSGSFGSSANLTFNKTAGILSVNGTVAHASGSATSPSIQSLSSPNTGLWFPAANTLAVSTAGTERLRVDASGNVSIGTTSTTYKLEVAGSFAAQTKSFVISHPTKPGMKLRYGSLEGPENGVYVRGTLVNDNIIVLPDYWTELVDAESLTVELTPFKTYQRLYVKQITNNTITIGNYRGKGISCFYVVYGERKDVPKLETEVI